MKKIFSIMLMAISALGTVSAQTAFYTQDFSAGIPAGWTNTSTDKNGVSYTGTWKATTTGSHGSYSSGFTINSPTAANGFVIFDSDSLDSEPGTNPGGGPDLAPQDAMLKTSAINCSGHSNIILSFYHGYNLFSGDLYVYVSNGSTEDTFFLSQNYEAQFADGGIAQGASALPSIQERLDITDVAANQANVTVTFRWYNANYYFWMIDDINLLDAPTSDIKINRAGFQSYSIYPLSQLDSMQGFARVIEQGSTVQPNAKVATSVKFNALTSPVFTDTSSAGINMPVGIDSLLLGNNIFFPNNGIGRYSVAIKTFSDSIDAYLPDNIDTSGFQVSDSVYAMDLGTSGGAWPLNDASANISNDEYVNLFFKVVNQDTVTSITTSFAGGTGLTTAGSTVRATVYSIDPNLDPTLAGSYVPVVSTEIKSLTAANLGTYGTIKNCVLKIDNTTGSAGAAILTPGYYAVGVRGLSGTVYLHQPQRLVYGNYTGQVTGGIAAGGAVNLYRNVFGYIRMNFGHNFNLLTCSWRRTPVTFPVRPYQSITFSATTNATGSGISYRWDISEYNGGSVINVLPTQYGQSVKDTFQNADSFYVCLTVTQGNDSSSYCGWVVVKDFGVGIQDVSALNDINLVPNPTTGRVKIDVAEINGTVSVSVVNMLGEVVKTFSDESNGSFTKTYDVSSLANGVYLFKITNDGNTVTKRLSISK